MSAEAALVAALAAIYLLDCIVLLERGQALWSPGAMSFGSTHYQVQGKVVAFMNPFAPFIPVSRTLPLFSTGFGMDPAGVPRILGSLRLPAALQFVLVFLALPWCLYRAPGWPFVATLALAYANAILMLVFVAWRFGRAGVPRRPLIALGFAWLACLPLSVNSMRRAGLAFEVAMDAYEALRDLPPQRRERAGAELAAQVGEELLELGEGDERYENLIGLQRRLTGNVG